MPRLLEAFACFAAGSQTETFGNPTPSWVPLLAALLSLAILSLVGQYLWNHALCPLISIAKPAKSALHILGVAILATLLLP